MQNSEESIKYLEDINYPTHFYSELNKLEKSPRKTRGGISVTLFPLCDAGGDGGENPNVRFILCSMRHHFRIFKIAFLFYTIQNKSEKNIHAMIICIHTCKSKLNLFFLEPYLQLFQ